MDATIFCIIFACTMGLGLMVGIAIGFNLSEDQRCAGDLVIAPGDEDAPNYMFLDLAMEPEKLQGKGKVMLYIRNVEARK